VIASKIWTATEMCHDIALSKSNVHIDIDIDPVTTIARLQLKIPWKH